MPQTENKVLQVWPAYEREHATSAYLVIDKEYPEELRKQFDIDRINFTYLPEQIGESGATPNWNEVEILGRFAPYSVYASTSSEELSMTLAFYAHQDCISDVKQKVDFLRAMKYPVMHKGISYRPPPLLFVFGEFINRRVIVTSADATYKSPWYIGADEEGQNVTYFLLPMQAEVALTLRVVSMEYVTGPDVLRGIF